MYVKYANTLSVAGTSHSLSHTWATNCSVLAEAWKYWFPTGINIPATKTRPPVAKQCGQCARALKVDQQLERTSQLFTTMVNKCCRNGLHGNISPEGISRHRFPMNDMKSRWLRAIPRKKKLGAKQEQCSMLAPLRRFRLCYWQGRFQYHQGN